MKVYVSGPITGTTDYMGKFQKAEDYLCGEGYTVINPAKLNTLLPADTTHAEYMRVDIVLLGMCDAIYMLDGWKNSKGALMEIDYAETNGLTILYETKPKKIKGMDYGKWLRHKFSTGCYPGDDYLKFQKEMKADLKRMAVKAGLTVEKFISSHYCFCAVLINTDGRRAYVSIPDVRGYRPEWYENVLYRTMAHENDWKGGNNHFTTWPEVCEQAAVLIA